MASKLLVPRFRVRVLHPVTGAEITSNLPHAHGITWEVLALQAGASGGAQVGQFEIPLLPPRHRLYKAQVATLSQLDYGMRVEAYLSAWGQSIGGNPYFSGYLRKLPRDTGTHKLQGDDAPGLAQYVQAMRTAQFSGTTDALLKYALNGYTLTFGDDFSGTLANFTNNGGWGAPALDEGLTTTARGSSGDGLLYTTSSFNNAQYADCYVQADNWHLVCGTTAGNTAEAGCIAAVADANNFILGRAYVTCISSTRFEVAAEIWQKSGGVYTQRAGKPRVVVYPTSTGRLQVRLAGKQLSSTTYQWTVIVEGIDSGCTWVQTVTNGNPTGAIGLRSAAGVSAFAHKCIFASWTALYQQGAIAAGSKSISQVVGSQAIGDLWVQAATTEGVLYRVNSRPGLFADTVDYGPSVGTDWSNTVELREGQHITDIQIAPNHESLATGLIASAAAGPDNSGVRVWHNVKAAAKYNLVWDNVQLNGVADAGSQGQILNALAALRGAPGQSKIFTVRFTPDMVGANGGLVFREGDFLRAHAPSYGLFHQKFQVLGYKVTEGSPLIDITGDQYPAAKSAQQMRRLRSTIDALAAGVGNATPSSGSGLVFDSRTGSPNVVPYYSGYQGVDSSHNCLLRFEIYPNMQAIQRVLLTLHLKAWRASQQSTASGTTSGSGGGQTPTSNGANTLHFHTLPTESGSSGASVFYDGITKLLAIGSTDTLGTSNDNVNHTHTVTIANHTHSIPNLSLQSPTGLIDQAMAQGCHVFLQNISGGGSQIDITSSLGGPFGSGSALDVADLDLSSFVNSGGIWELQVSSTTLGGIIAELAVFCIAKSL